MAAQDNRISGYALKITGILPANVNDIAGMTAAAEGLDRIKAALASSGVRDVKVESNYRQRAKVEVGVAQLQAAE